MFIEYKTKPHLVNDNGFYVYMNQLLNVVVDRDLLMERIQFLTKLINKDWVAILMSFNNIKKPNIDQKKFFSLISEYEIKKDMGFVMLQKNEQVRRVPPCYPEIIAKWRERNIEKFFLKVFEGIGGPIAKDFHLNLSDLSLGDCTNGDRIITMEDWENKYKDLKAAIICNNDSMLQEPLGFEKKNLEQKLISEPALDNFDDYIQDSRFIDCQSSVYDVHGLGPNEDNMISDPANDKFSDHTLLSLSNKENLPEWERLERSGTKNFSLNFDKDANDAVMSSPMMSPVLGDKRSRAYYEFSHPNEPDNPIIDSIYEGAIPIKKVKEDLFCTAMNDGNNTPPKSVYDKKSDNRSSSRKNKSRTTSSKKRERKSQRMTVPSNKKKD